MKKKVLVLSFLLCSFFSMNVMAADPVLVDCPIDTWTKVVTNTSKVEIVPIVKTRYLYTLRDTGGASPANNDDSLLLPSIGVSISALPAVDVYIKTQRAAGTVRVASFSDTVIVSGTISVVDSALPSGASTEAKQDTLQITNNAIQSSLELVRLSDPNNSTISTLGNSGVYTGTWVDVLGYTSVILNILTDQDSATNGLEVQGSDNASDVIHNHQFSVTSTTPLGQHYVFTLVNRYYRVVYTNDTTPQTIFNLNSVLSKHNVTHSHTHPINFAFDDNHDAAVTRAILSAKNPGDIYVNIGATGGGNLKIAIEEWANGLAVNGGEQLKVTEFNSVGSELWGTAVNISENDLHVVIDQAIHSGSNNIGGIEIVDPLDDGRRLGFDNIFLATQGIDIEHYAIHMGYSFVTEAIDVSMADNAEIIIAFKTPNTTKVPHLVIDFSSKAAAHVELIESPTWSTSTGSQLPVFNINRNSANTTDLLEDTGGSFVDSNNVILNPSSLTGGTVIPDGHTYAFVATGLGGQTRARGGSETPLATDTLYAVKLTADAGSNAGHLKLRWYEKAPE